MQNTPTEKRAAGPQKIEITARTKIYILIAVWVVAAIKTIIPFPYVSKPCLLGYKSGCSFAPISTVILVIGAAITYVVAKKKKIL